HSAGCLVAAQTYFKAPERVAAMILVAPAIIALFLLRSIINLFKGMANMVDSVYKKALSSFLGSRIVVMLVRMVIDKFGIADIGMMQAKLHHS
ncbi:putative hydrolase/acyltransferase, partial [Tanacetum coccineum]